jgi:hypothetical protein
LDGTQTSDPTEAGPGSAPGQASAYRRALDDQAMTDGPLDLTVPLSIAEVRAALASTGPLRKVGLAAYAAAAKSASVASARPHDGHGHSGGHGHRRLSTRHAAVAASRRLGRMAAFVAITAALSVGTACALVLSNNAQNTSVSLPATGAIPVAPSVRNPQPGQIGGDSGSTSAQAAPSLSRSTGRQLPVAASTTKRATSTPSSPSATGTASADPSSSTSAGSSASASAPATSPSTFGPAPSAGSSPQWEVLYTGENEDSQAQQETTDVQSLLLNLGFLAPWHHRSYIDPDYSVSPDPNGYYGSATADAIAQFQQDYGVDYTDQLGDCDADTYQALVEVYDEAQAE